MSRRQLDQLDCSTESSVAEAAAAARASPWPPTDPSLPLPLLHTRPGLTKVMSKLSKEGAWRKALEVYEAVEEMG